MADLKNEVQEWLKTKHYEKGIAILSKYARNNKLLRYLTGNKTNVKADKLLYVLLKLSGQKDLYSKKSRIMVTQKADRKAEAIKKEIEKVQEQFVLKPKQRKGIVIGAPENKSSKKLAFNKLPLIIQEVIKQKGHLWLQKDVLFAKLQKVPEDNTDQNIEKRRALVAKIDHYSKRIDFLYKTEIAFTDSKIIPSDDILIWSEIPEADAAPENEDFSAITDLNLGGRISNLRSYITKDENLLLYQSKSKAGNVENPMPPGPRRKKIETRISLKQAQLNELIAIQQQRAGSA